MADEVLRDHIELVPEAADLVDRPDEWYIDDDEVFIICGVEFPAREFTESERLEWLKIREKHDLAGTEAKYRDLLVDATKTERSNLLKIQRDRLQKVKDEARRIIDTTNPLEWTPEQEEYVGELAAKADELEEQIAELEKPVDQELYNRMDEMQSVLAELKAARDPAFLEMSWKIARTKYGEARSLEQWSSDAKGGDRLAAQELVHKGNFLWETPRLNRAQRRELHKSHRRTKSTTTTTDGTTSKQ